MKTANDAVLLAIKTVSVLKSEMHRTFIDRLNDGRKEASSSEINKILESYIEAGIGFGAAYNIKSSILQSIFDSPFLGVGLKDSHIGIFLHTFRQTTKYTRDIIISTIYDPTVEPNLLITAVLTLGVGFIFTLVANGGGDSTRSLVMPSLAIPKMDGDMASFSALMRMGQGW
ncbi:hypothetical protein JHK84_055960 [Glycine max]|nr:hypothetical protein JHK85_056938 [Glycine max]KAG5074729.1 hypothetical protein JHK84_055960 [Glycine max]